MSRLERNYLVDSLADTLPYFPDEGIAYRGDSQQYANGSLQRSFANYILFNPSKYDDIEQLTTELHEGINFALQFSYPPQWEENPKNPIMGQFDGYTQHYAENPQDLPVLSWGTATYLGQLMAAHKNGRCFYTSNARIAAGRVDSQGPLAPRTPIPATLEDIHEVESSVELPSISNSKLSMPLKRRNPPSHAEYLADEGRSEFHSRLGILMATKLLAVIKEGDNPAN